MLGPIDYGSLAALTNIIAICSVPTTAIQTLVSKYTTPLNLKKKFGEIRGLRKHLLKKLFFISIGVFLVYLLLSYIFYKNLKMSYLALALTGLFLIVSFTYPVLTGVAQGMKKFKEIGWNFVINGLVKVFFSVVLVLLGLRIYGAVASFSIGLVVAMILMARSLKEINTSKSKEYKITLASKESLFLFVPMFLLVLFYSLDVIFAKIIFAPEIVGNYAVISMIGKIIFFVISSIGLVMFPINSEKFLKGEATSGVLKKSLGLAFLVSVLAIAAFLLFPEIIIWILFGSEYLSLSKLLVYSGIAFSSISILYLFVLYSLSVNRFKIKSIFLLIGLLGLQILCFILFRDNINNFSLAFAISSIIGAFGGLLFLKK